ncbi:MAG: hypothetical protein JF591_00035 [Lysobacter sp.]|nr:hypothetical protein [Lysobacter sp.]
MSLIGSSDRLRLPLIARFAMTSITRGSAMPPERMRGVRETCQKYTKTNELRHKIFAEGASAATLFAPIAGPVPRPIVAQARNL